MSLIGRGIQTCLNLLYPPSCLQCHSYSREPICQNCAPLFAAPDLYRCQRCGIFIPTPKESKKPCLDCKGRSVLYIQAPLLHRDEISEAISHFKYAKQIAWAPFFAATMYRHCRDYIENFDILTPVPLHRSRLRQRGFNQSEELAAQLSKLCHKPVAKLVRRRSQEHTQKGLTRRERLANLDAVFSPRGSAEGRRVLLIDDVTTTGTTLYKCAQSIKDAATVGGLSITRRL